MSLITLAHTSLILLLPMAVFAETASTRISDTDIVAITPTGKKVLLMSNGTWKSIDIQQSAVKYDFRKTQWGDTKESVKASENFKLLTDNPESLIYSGNIGFLETILAYVFIDNKLIRAKYNMGLSNTHYTNYISAYKSLLKDLTYKYGPPKSEKIVWKDDTYKKNPDKWEQAILYGLLSYSAEWNTKGATIALYLDGDTSRITLVVEYISKQYGALENSSVSQVGNEAL